MITLDDCCRWSAPLSCGSGWWRSPRGMLTTFSSLREGFQTLSPFRSLSYYLKVCMSPFCHVVLHAVVETFQIFRHNHVFGSDASSLGHFRT